MFNYYINNIQVYGISTNPSATIIREDGFQNKEQILREKTEAEIIFNKDAYQLICSLRQNYCTDFELRIDIVCGLEYETFFTSIVKHTDIELFVNQKYGTIKSLSDNSFSAKIVLYKDTQIPLYYTNTLNCQPIELVAKGIVNTNYIINGYSLAQNKYSIDVLDAIRFVVGWITDNNINVVSDYLTNNPIHISTGYSMHNSAGTLDQLYPSFSLSELLSELRKKTTLYTIIEQDQFGNIIFRIEDEDYSYGTDVVLQINGLPNDFKESMDIENIYNQIKVGSTTTDTEDNIVVPQKKLKAWNEESYFGCGCDGLKDSVLDLVSNYIIDANVIYEALRTPIGDDYDKDNDIFMYAVEPIGADFRIQGYVGQQFNTFMNNENVLNRWVGIANSCILLNRTAKYGFEVEEDLIEVSSGSYASGIVFTSDINNIARYGDPLSPIYDNENSLFNDNTGPDVFTYFLCQENGNYTFVANGLFYQYGGATPVVGADLYISIEAWSGIGGILIGYEEFVISSADLTTNEYQMSLEATFGLAVGNIVFVRYRMVYSGVGFQQWQVASKENSFKLLSDSFSCEDLEDITSNFKPFISEFTNELCFEDYKELRYNKRGIIRINDVDMWIREVKLQTNGASSFRLKYKNSMC